MNTNPSAVDVKRTTRIERAIKKTGAATLADEFGITPWAVYKWATNGFVPNQRLKGFCKLTKEKPAAVCDPCIASLMRS